MTDDPGIENAAARMLSALAETAPAMRRGTVLVVDDEEGVRASIRAILEETCEILEAEDGAGALEMLRTHNVDLVMLDQRMPGEPGIEVLPRIKAFDPSIVVVLATAVYDVRTAVLAMQRGAYDYVVKPFDVDDIVMLTQRVLEKRALEREVLLLRSALADDPWSGHTAFEGLVGRNPQMVRIYQLVSQIAETPSTVLITGESGTGKELIAQFIHQYSRRAHKPLVPINCAALPEGLLESELFGHRKGAFTGADRDKPGLLETANGGTLFLDELTEMSLPLQAKLLRVIQDGVVRRVGSEQVDAVVDVRFISATNRDPQDAVEEGALRSDLFYRLRVVPINLPPLRKRQEDIPLLANHFLTYYWQRHRHRADRVPRLSEASVAFLRSRPWRGNVRELQNVIEHVAVLAEPDQVIQPSDIPIYDDAGEWPAESLVPSSVMDEAYHTAKDRVVAQFEREYLTRLISRAGGNMSKAARLASIDRTTLYRLMDKHEFHRDETAGTPE